MVDNDLFFLFALFLSISIPFLYCEKKIMTSLLYLIIISGINFVHSEIRRNAHTIDWINFSIHSMEIANFYSNW